MHLHCSERPQNGLASRLLCIPNDYRRSLSTVSCRDFSFPRVDFVDRKSKTMNTPAARLLSSPLTTDQGNRHPRIQAAAPSYREVNHKSPFVTANAHSYCTSTKFSLLLPNDTTICLRCLLSASLRRTSSGHSWGSRLAFLLFKLEGLWPLFLPFMAILLIVSGDLSKYTFVELIHIHIESSRRTTSQSLPLPILISISGDYFSYLTTTVS